MEYWSDTTIIQCHYSIAPLLRLSIPALGDALTLPHETRIFRASENLGGVAKW
jgi:hypothetical protein